MSADKRVFNFSAGPATIPLEVLAQAQSELLDWRGCGMSVMEMSHRGPEFSGIAERAETDLRGLLNIPDQYHLLFLQGGASSQFSMVPLNLLGSAQGADYADTGFWSQKAILEAERYGTINVCTSAQDSDYKSVPDFEHWRLSAKAAYLHITPNETIGGLEFAALPDTGGVPIVADLSSTILSRPLAIERYGLIYAGAQKNIGPAGLTLVIIRDDLLDRAASDCPSLYNYRKYVDAKSMLNTPPTYAWYLSGLVFQWLQAQGGLSAIETINRRKAEKLYRAIDASDFYDNSIDPAFRSIMNVTFTLERPQLDDEFVQSAEQAGLVNLKGHRAVGGMRASLYNAMPEAGVDALVEFMQDFASLH